MCMIPEIEKIWKIYIFPDKSPKITTLPVSEIDENLHTFSTSNEESYIIKDLFAPEMEVAQKLVRT